MHPLGSLHLAAALVALASGAWVLLARKGGRAHRRVGWTYAASMLVLNGTALLIYRLTGRFGPFHVAALVSLGGLVAGVVAARRRGRDPHWLARHYYFMTWSYVGLVAAAVSETATRMAIVREAMRAAGVTTLAFWTAVGASTALVVGVGAVLIRRNAPAMLRRFAPRAGA